MDNEDVIGRLSCTMNGEALSLPDMHTAAAREGGIVKNWHGHEWLVVAQPPVVMGENWVTIEVLGAAAPEPWPIWHQCEVVAYGV